VSRLFLLATLQIGVEKEMLYAPHAPCTQIHRLLCKRQVNLSKRSDPPSYIPYVHVTSSSSCLKDPARKSTISELGLYNVASDRLIHRRARLWTFELRTTPSTRELLSLGDGSHLETDSWMK
jgi:hypothetical protein